MFDKTDDNLVVRALIDAGAPKSQVANARALANDAPDQQGAGVPYTYPVTKEESKEKFDEETGAA